MKVRQVSSCSRIDRILDDDAAPRGERDGADDGHGNGNEQWAGRGDDQHGEEAFDMATQKPCENGNTDGQGGVPGSENVAETAEFGAALLGFFHNAHDARVARIGCEPFRSNDEHGFAV